MINAAIIEDSAVMREFLRHILESEDGIRVMGTAVNGREGVDMVLRLKPDVVLMDIIMPEMDGFEATKRIMEHFPVPIIVVSASYDPSEVRKTFMALDSGAVAVLEKPKGLGHPESERMIREIVRTVRLMSEVRVVRRWKRKAVSKEVRPGKISSPPEKEGEARAVLIGASTGGPSAIQAVLLGLSGRIEVPVFIVQHIAPGFVKGFTGWLSDTTKLPVHLAAHSERPLSGHIYVAPDGRHLGVDNSGLMYLSAEKPENGMRPSISFLFRSGLAVYGKKMIGVLLSGMGKDGAAELAEIRRAGAQTIVQDSKTAIVYGIPGAALKLDGADYVLSPERIAGKIELLTRKSTRKS